MVAALLSLLSGFSLSFFLSSLYLSCFSLSSPFLLLLLCCRTQIGHSIRLVLVQKGLRTFLQGTSARSIWRRELKAAKRGTGPSRKILHALFCAFQSEGTNIGSMIPILGNRDVAATSCRPAASAF
jgi:hypothetical protein